MVDPRPPTGIPARRGGRAEFPHVYQPDDRGWDGETQRDRENVWRADDHGEAIGEAIPGSGSEGFLRDEAAAQFGAGAERGSDRASAAIAR